MHSFHQSRGRIAFEILCTLTVSASCLGAWMQTGATALLPAAFATGLYGLWHLTDLHRRAEQTAAMPSGAEAHVEVQHVPSPVEMIAPAPSAAIEAGEIPKPKRRSRKKQADAASMASSIIETELEIRKGFPDRATIEEELHPPIAPLFEAKPFAQHRPTFGRKAG